MREESEEKGAEHAADVRGLHHAGGEE